MNRLFTKLELADAYRIPQQVRQQLLAAVVAVEKNDLGEPLFLESHVDSWLADRYGGVSRRSSGDDFLTTREVACLLRCSYCEARERLLDGRIRAIKAGGGCELAGPGSRSMSPQSP